MPGFTRGRNLAKAGMHAQDTAELFFADVRVPVANLIGQENRGFYHLMTGLPQERLGCAVHSAAAMERALALTLDFVKSRHVFGSPLGEGFQVTRFQLADVATTVSVARAYVDRAIEAHLAGDLSNEEAASAKLWTSQRQGEVTDASELFGGAGYMDEYEISRLWRDSRVQRIYAGSSEGTREIIGRGLLLTGYAPGPLAGPVIACSSPS